MNTPGNARGMASRIKICDAMLTLLNEKPMNKITVQEVIKRAGVNRSTFYAHYLDINDLMDKIEAEKVKEIPLRTQYAGGATADTIFSTEALEELMAYFRENRIFYRVYFNSLSESRWIKESSALMRHGFIEPYLEHTKQFTKEEYEFQFEFCKAGFSGVIRRWLDNDCEESDKLVAGVLKKLFWKCLG